MKTQTHLLLFLLIVIFSCDDETPCVAEDANIGLIEKVYNIEEIPASVEKHVEQNTTLFVRDTSDLIAQIDTSDTPETANRPEFASFYRNIDFANYSLLGFWATASGCETEFVREVIKNDETKSYNYKLEVLECGECKMLRFSPNLILVPKIEEDYTVEFQLVGK